MKSLVKSPLTMMDQTSESTATGSKTTWTYHTYHDEEDVKYCSVELFTDGSAAVLHSWDEVDDDTLTIERTRFAAFLAVLRKEQQFLRGASIRYVLKGSHIAEGDLYRNELLPADRPEWFYYFVLFPDGWVRFQLNRYEQLAGNPPMPMKDDMGFICEDECATDVWIAPEGITLLKRYLEEHKQGG